MKLRTTCSPSLGETRCTPAREAVELPLLRNVVYAYVKGTLGATKYPMLLAW
jgi:hypothetical protein